MLEPESTLPSRLIRELTRIHEDVEKRFLLRVRFLLRPLIEYLRPTIERLRQDDHTREEGRQLAVFLNNIEDILSSFATGLQTHASLSFGEVRIALLIKQGLSDEAIALQLQITPATVKTHRRNIRKKLGLTGTTQKLRPYLQAMAQDAAVVERIRKTG
jgi:DNA-binding CsgD family transcriptional regulator